MQQGLKIKINKIQHQGLIKQYQKKKAAKVRKSKQAKGLQDSSLIAWIKRILALRVSVNAIGEVRTDSGITKAHVAPGKNFRTKL